MTEAAGSDGAEGAAGGIPAMCRSFIAGRRATVRGGALRLGRTAAGRALWTEAEAEAGAEGNAETEAGPVSTGRHGADMATGSGLAAAAVSFAGSAPAVAGGTASRPVGGRGRRPGAPLDRRPIAGTGFPPVVCVV
ncbi:hypothetical protein [Streptomyces katsurahamanus]|uniref:Uncharacterized protein n=1 Tax=Streptomyces katsurahamanus TaxID=2577098 RepID=A0ABW9NY22_9ACTN|nr:hypothetical protein [Streptomyces katsurahamanus]MQS38170.1 hypothetical protein [Streptomyces katsurahamanus]